LKNGAVVLATPETFSEMAALHLSPETLGKEGYLLRSASIQGHHITLIVANTDIGLLYGTFAWLRVIQTQSAVNAFDLRETPGVQLRVLNHWDNLDRSVERGYAGESIWNWWALPEIHDQRYVDYARANASLGINGTVLNNVNARPEILTSQWLAKVRALADVLRPYGIKVYLSVRFSTPLELGETAIADPLDPAVIVWWQKKADEIYQLIPDFGGFLVKANSEGQPGPQNYQRTHAEGANMLAQALLPHHGVLIWRAFVYADDQLANRASDRAKEAYEQFKPLDGSFAPNVMLQVKNGPIDFQPREPAHPLFGAMPKTPLMMEFQITKEYLGFATHLVYLGSLYEEILQSDTGLRAEDAKVADIIDGSFHHSALSGIAGVANIGSDRNWSGSEFDQANWYAFGRLAWNPHASARKIAGEWVAQTFSNNPSVVAQVSDLMMMSREAAVNYMTPLGLHHLMGTGHHYGPAPWVSDLKRPEWNPVYYHQADINGIGFDRTASGSNAIAQYSATLARLYADPQTTPEKYLLWFHHLPWDYVMPSGASLWVELLSHYDSGVAQVVDMQERWARLSPLIDRRRHAEVAERLAKQFQEAKWWRDACVAYFQSVSGLPLPYGVKSPSLTLDEYQAKRFPFAPGGG
jgi:alpha-glucuronidase